MTGPIDFNGKTYAAGAQKNVKNDTIGQKPKFNPGGIFKEAAKGAVRGGAEGLTNPPKKLENVDLTMEAEVEYTSKEVTLLDD